MYCSFFQETASKLDVTADFHKLNILLMRLESIKGCKHARKVATFTMSSAQLQATVGKLYFKGGQGQREHLQCDLTNNRLP